MAKPSMGFLADLKPAPSRRQKPDKPEIMPDPRDLVVSFDSGRGLSFSDSLHHLMCFGTTGSGKTASVLLPAINRIMRAGHGLIMGDIKGSLGGFVRKLAVDCGRAGDVVEYGSGPLAERKNALAYMANDGIRSFFESMVKEIASGDSRIWALKGAAIAADCAILLRYVSKKRHGFWPTMSMINEMINDRERASEFYNMFLDNHYDESDEEQRRFVTSIDNNRFHLLVRAKKAKESYSYKPDSGKHDNAYEEQVTWNMQAIRLALRSFLEAPGIERNFSAYASPGIDLPGDIDAGKIILLRFDARSGQTGATLTRKLLSEAYGHVLSGKMVPKRFHVVLDEFQEYADFSDSAGSDKSFVALAREFGGSFIAGTQSVSALTCKVGNAMPVEAFLGNCNSIMSFYSHDAATQELACRYNPRIKLNRLKPGQLFAVTYDSSGRVHNQHLESVNRGYRELSSLLASLPESQEGKDDEAVADPSWSQLEDALKGEIESKREEEKRQAEAEERRKKWEAREKAEMERRRREAERRQQEERMREARDDAWDLPGDRQESGNGEADCEKKELDPFVERLRGNFPDLLSERFEADIPDGWKDFALEALGLFKAIGMKISKIRALTVSEGRMRALVGNSYDDTAAYEVLNSILSKSGRLCMICGKEKGKGSFPVCEDCRKGHMVARDRENSQLVSN